MPYKMIRYALRNNAIREKCVNALTTANCLIVPAAPVAQIQIQDTRVTPKCGSQHHSRYDRKSFFSTATVINNDHEAVSNSFNSLPPLSRSEILSAAVNIPSQFLRQSSQDRYDPNTHQRSDCVVDTRTGKVITNPIEINSKVENVSIKNDDEGGGMAIVHVEFEDGYVGEFSSEWIQTQYARLNQSPLDEISPILPRLPWTNLTEEDFRTSSYQMEFEDIVSYNKEESGSGSETETGIQNAMQILYQSGILLVTSTPVLSKDDNDNKASIAALASALSGSAYKTSPETSPLARYWHENENENENGESSSSLRPTSTATKRKRKRKLDLEDGTDGPQRTLFGKVWSTQSEEMAEGASTADSAYSTDSLPLHTDMTYYRDPPGLQIFSMVSPAEEGGESTFGDGLAVAEFMRSHHPQEFDTLCRTVRHFRSIDPTNGWYLEGSGPMIQAVDRYEGRGPLEGSSLESPVGSLSDQWGPVVAIRHNDLDRLPDLPPPSLLQENNSNQDQDELLKEFYNQLTKAHKIWDGLLNDDAFRLVVKLKPGDTVVVANQRCFHGRQSFVNGTSPRSVMGCYVSQDDFESRVRWMLRGNCRLQ